MEKKRGPKTVGKCKFIISHENEKIRRCNAGCYNDICKYHSTRMTDEQLELQEKIKLNKSIRCKYVTPNNLKCRNYTKHEYCGLHQNPVFINHINNHRTVHIEHNITLRL